MIQNYENCQKGGNSEGKFVMTIGCGDICLGGLNHNCYICIGLCGRDDALLWNVGSGRRQPYG